MAEIKKEQQPHSFKRKLGNIVIANDVPKRWRIHLFAHTKKLPQTQ